MRVYTLCNRFVGHWWKELEPGVKRCNICRCLHFDEGATHGTLSFYLLGNAASTTEPPTGGDSQ